MTTIDTESEFSLEDARELARLRALLNTPELNDFAKAIPLEAAHQRQRWGEDHDAKKDPEDWFWTLGYLAGKAMRAHTEDDYEKAKHHTITAAALLANWHARVISDGEAHEAFALASAREATAKLEGRA